MNKKKVIEPESVHRSGNIDNVERIKDRELTYPIRSFIRMGMVFIYLLTLLITSISAGGATTITVNPGGPIQDAIDSLPPEGGGIVELAPGVHNVNDTIILNRSNVTIIGTNESEIRCHNSSKDIFNINVDWEGHPALDNITFNGFKVTSTYGYEWPYHTNSLIRANNVNNLTVESLYDLSSIRNFVDINWGAWGQVANEGLRILNNTIQNSAMTFVFCKNATVAYNTIIGNPHSCYAMAISPGNAYITVHDNYIDNVGTNANIRTESFEGHIYNNTCKGSQIGISARYGTHNILIENNTITGAIYMGIEFYSNYGLKNQTARNNIIYDCPGQGIQIAEIAWAHATGTSDVTILNNVIHNCGGDGIGRGPKTESTWILNISNNIITNNIGYGMDLAHENITETHSYNNIWNNTAGNYYNALAGTGDISVNPLFADPGSGDFHLKSIEGRWNGSTWVVDAEHSSCIDAGKPSFDYSNEPEPNGGRLNIGVYGNTGEASKSGIPYFVSGYVNYANGTGVYNTYVTNNVTAAADNYTDANGHYILKHLANGTYNITATLTSFVPNSIIVTISGANVCNANITLEEVECHTYKLVNSGESIQEAIDGLCQPGGTIELAAGVHNVSDTIVINRSNVTIQGTQDSEIRSHDSNIDIFAIPHENPTAGEDWENMPVLNNFLFQGFKVTSSYTSTGKNSINAWNVKNLTVEDIRDTSHLFCLIATSPGGYSTVQNEDIFIRNNSLLHSSIAFAFSENVHIINNTLLDVSGVFGINIKRNNKKVYISDNYVYGGDNYNIRGHGGSYVYIYNNTLVNARDAGFHNDGVTHLLMKANTIRETRRGIWIHPQGNLINQTYINNCIYECADGFYTEHYSQGFSGYNTNADIINNIIYNNAGNGIHMRSKHVQLNISNNIITNNICFGINCEEKHNATVVTYNNVWNNTLGNYNGTTNGTGNISLDPLFADLTTGDFHLKSQTGRWNGTDWVNDFKTSPCIDAGDPNSTYSNEPSPNGGRINIGAYGNTKEASKSPPNILTFYPRSPVRDVAGKARIFNITVDQIVNVTWLINGTQVQPHNESVTEATYTNTSAEAGTWNVSAIATSVTTGLSAMQTWTWIVQPAGFDTAPGTYPSISGTHNGTITPCHDVYVSKMYTCPCAGTGGHSESVRFYNASWSVEANWSGYQSGDYHFITFDEFILEAGTTYIYTIRTGSYPQIIHNKTFVGIDGEITCTNFTDVNGRVYYDWIPAIRLE